MAQTKRLTTAFVRNAKEPGVYPDGDRLYLQVTTGKNGQANKSWLFRFKLRGKERQMGLGSLNVVGLADARDEAERCRKLVRQGKDPIQLRNAERAQEHVTSARSQTFDQCAAAYMAAKEVGWKNAKHREQWRNTLKAYASPVIGKLPVGEINTGLVMRVIQPIWTTKPETAGRVRGRIEAILDWAKVIGYREGENPARWRGHLDHLLAARGKVRKVRPQPALPHAQIGEFMAALRAQQGSGARALEFAILCGARSGEVRKARWDGDEINITEKVWMVPADRMKGGREHRVPLSPAAIAVIEQMLAVRQSNWVFAGDREGNPLSDMTLTEVIRRMNEARQAAGLPRWTDPKQGGREVVPHGFRSTFRDWLSERTSFARELGEAALAHVAGDKVEAAYSRTGFFEKRRRLMDAWAAACGRAEGPKVVHGQFGRA